MKLTDRRQHLLSTDRWRELGAFVDRWYAHPISDADGHSPLEIEQVSNRLGTQLPAVLHEWFELVGRRLHDVQDLPVRLDELVVQNGAVRMWIENQGVWSLCAPLDAGDDPVCFVVGDGSQDSRVPLTHALFGMVVSDTLVGAWSPFHIKTRIGVLGELASSVRGGYCDDFSDEQAQRLESAYPTLPHSINPTFDEPYRGNETTVICNHQVAIQWMTSTDDAFAAINAVFDLAPPNGEHEVTFTFDGLDQVQLRYLSPSDPHWVPDSRLFDVPLAGAGNVSMTTGGDDPSVRIRTKNPQCVLALILASLPIDLLPHLTVTTRPIAVSATEVIYRNGKTTS